MLLDGLQLTIAVYSRLSTSIQQLWSGQSELKSVSPPLCDIKDTEELIQV